MEKRHDKPPHSLGVDVGGTGIKCALVDLSDGSLASDRFRLDTPQPSLPPAVVGTIADVVSNLEHSGPAGVAFPGVMRGGIVATTANLDDAWDGVSLSDALAPVLPGPIAMLNDADAAALAEVRYGAGQGQSGLVVMVTLGTGIGTGLVYDGVLIPNAELGHIEVDGHDAETRASASARERRRMSWAKWARKVEKYLHRMEDLLWPDLFILGGGVSKHPERWFDFIETRTPKVIAALANNAGIVGAALNASEMNESDQHST